MEENKISEIMDMTMTKIKQLVDTNTIIGVPITTPDGIVAVPISRVSFGFGTGGAGNAGKGNTYAGGNGGGVKVEPVGFLIIKDGNCRMLNITTAPHNSADRLIEMLPDLIDKVEGFVDKTMEKKNNSAVG